MKTRRMGRVDDDVDEGEEISVMVDFLSKLLFFLLMIGKCNYI